jgi:hypothetical protein
MCPSATANRWTSILRDPGFDVFQIERIAATGITYSGDDAIDLHVHDLMAAKGQVSGITARLFIRR